MVNDFVDFSSFIRFHVLLLNSECKGTKKYTHTQVSEHIFLKKKTTPYSPICCLAYKTLLPLGIFGKPTTLYTLLLLEEFEDRPETRESNNSQNNR